LLFDDEPGPFQILPEQAISSPVFFGFLAKKGKAGHDETKQTTGLKSVAFYRKMTIHLPNPIRRTKKP